ncbi:MAG: hypothetical protein ACKO15_13925 [Burkholderiales bacterium]
MHPPGALSFLAGSVLGTAGRANRMKTRQHGINHTLMSAAFKHLQTH